MADDKKEDLSEGTLLSHLVELRSRLFKIFGAVFLVFLAMLPFSKELFALAAEPLISVLPDGELQSTRTVGPLTATIGLTFYFALFTAMPYVLFQLWAFVAPGLYKKEKRFTIPLLATSILLFFCGIAFAYYVVFPMIFGFISAFSPDELLYKPDASEYVSFIMLVILVFGFAFETPIATVLLVMTGITTTAKLKKARPYVFLGAFVVGMLLTPPDMISQTMLAIPVYLLFELGIFMSHLVSSKEKEPADEAAVK